MENTVPHFSVLLSSLLVDERMTPTRLAAAAGVTAQSVEAWLRGGQIPRSDTVWKVSEVLTKNRERIFAAAALSTQSRMEATFNSANPLKWEKSLSTFMSAGLDRLNGDDVATFTKIWGEKVLPVWAGTLATRSRSW